MNGHCKLRGTPTPKLDLVDKMLSRPASSTKNILAVFRWIPENLRFNPIYNQTEVNNTHQVP
jgi:hypothetical protein